MHREELTVERREKTGKGVARSLRREGKIPGVLYSGGKAESLALSPVDVKRILKHGENALITLKVGGEKSKDSRVAILRDIDRDPVSGDILHADLFEISMNKPIRVPVPLHVTGTPVGVKEGGVLQHNLREIEIECLPALIPEEIGVDASALGIGDNIHVRELVLAEGIRILEDLDQIVVSVAAPISDAKLEQLLTATPAEAGKEPEVVAKKKEDEEEAAADGKTKPDEKAKPAEGKEAEKGAKPSQAPGKEGKPKG